MTGCHVDGPTAKLPAPAPAAARSDLGPVVRYSAKRLQELGMLEKKPSEGIDIETTAGPFLGFVNLRPITLKDADRICESDLKADGFEWMNLAMNFEVPGATPGKDCVFRLVMGPPAHGWFKLVGADSSDLNVAEHEPVAVGREGWALLGGTMPAARGRRSRGGAPGTQFAIEMTGKSDDSNDIDYFYLLNPPGSKTPAGQYHKLNVRGDNDSSETAISTDPADKPAYIVVGTDGKAIKMYFGAATPAARSKFFENAKKAAECVQLPGA